jgi:putative hydrolase of the HAD superfamily
VSAWRDALLLDIGDVIVDSPWNFLVELENERGVRFPGHGPNDERGDPHWAGHLRGEMSMGEYWDRMAAAAGYDGWRSLFRDLSDVAPERLFDPAALELIRDAQRAGRRVGVLTNDGVAINGREFFDSRPELAGLDAFVDATEIGVRKPAPDAYLIAAEALGVAPSSTVFLDDTLACVEGARAVGMVGVLVDPFDKGPAFARAREHLGLTSSRAARLVRAAEAAYLAQDLDAIMRLFHPDITITWNGRKVATGLAQAREFHVEQLGFGSAVRQDYRLSKTLRAADGDTIAVEWESSHRDAEGRTWVGSAGEFWTMRGDLVIEWHAYHHRLEGHDSGPRSAER